MLVKAQNLSFSYPGGRDIQFPDLGVAAGDALLILGKSGSGKTTFLNLLAGLLTPKAGEVQIDGQNLNTLSNQKLDQFRGSKIGLVFQKPHLLAPLSVLDNLKLAPFFGKTEGQDPLELLGELQIQAKANSPIQSLSEGEAQRVSIARALMNKPKVILADEPTSSLDDENAEIVTRLLQQQAKKISAALIIVTHDQRVKNLIPNFVQVSQS